MSRFAPGRFTVAAFVGATVWMNGMDINNFGPSVAMTQPETRRRSRAGAEPEEVTMLTRAATDAANAFRDYIIGGDPARRQAFWDIYNRRFGGATYHDNSTFMNQLFSELDRIGQDPEVRRMLEAYSSDQGRLFGFLWSNPVHFTDFIDAVHNIRTVYEGRAGESAVRTLATQARGGSPARADSDIGRVRAAREADSSLSIEDAARRVLMDAAREEARLRYGESLTAEVYTRMPAQLARRGVEALRDYMLTGNDARRAEFRRLWDANQNYQPFIDAFQTEARARISGDTESGLSAIVRAYNTRHGGTDPIALADMVTSLYRAAAGTDAAAVESLRTAEGTDVIDPLLAIVARGMAGRAITLLRDVVENGTPASRDAYVALMNGRLAMIENGAVQMPTVEYNNVFFQEFTSRYRVEVRGNSRFATLVQSFQRNVLPIAIRDIYVELARAAPDRARLVSDYGPELVNLVAGSLQEISAWMMRSETDIASELRRRADAGDVFAVRLQQMQTSFPKPRALSDVYTSVQRERTARAGIDAETYRLIDTNLDQLSWLSGTPEAVQAELDRRARARPPDALVQQLAGRFPTGAGAGLSRAYAAISAIRTERARLVQAYGQEFVDAVTQNIDSVPWLVRPVEQIDREMRARRADAFVRSAGANPEVQYSVGNLAYALRDIYAELGRGSPDRARLTTAYGEAVVQYVETNRANLSWLGGDAASIERELLLPPADEYRRGVQGFLFRYTSVQLVTAISRARTAIARRGFAISDATDAYGTVFVGPTISRQAEVTPSRAPGGVQATRANIEARARSIVGEFEAIERSLRWDVLGPARVIIREQIQRWNQENQDIRLAAEAAQSETEMAALEQRQQRLINAMVNASDMRRCVEMAFAMVHLAETGGDMRGPAITGVTTTDADLGSLRRLMTWYNGLEASGKQPIVGQIVGAVLQRASPDLYRFITGMDEPMFIEGLVRVYSLTQRRGSETRQILVSQYGEQFVRMIEASAPHLYVLESPSTSMLRPEQNELFVAIVGRVYRALANPTQSENRAAMVALFGEEFVAAVQGQMSALAPLGTARPTMAAFTTLPEAARTAIWAAYPGAFRRNILPMVRAFRHQDESMFQSLTSVYAVLRNQPPSGAPAEDVAAYDARVQELYITHGERFVRTVAANMERLGFLRSPTASPSELSSLPPNVREDLSSAFEQGPGVGRANFMVNYRRLADRLPRVFSELSTALAFSSPTDTLATNFGNALRYYRDSFGNNDYLFTQYINLDLLSRNIVAMARRYGVTLPDFAQDGIQSPEELARFLGTEQGNELVRAGRGFYDGLERQYIAYREQHNFHPTEGDYTDANVTALRGQLSILDALYLGMALERVSGTDSAFGQQAATAAMNSILVISRRDPYLVGPFLLQVLPAILSVAQDERTLVAAIESFNAMFTQRYEAGTNSVAYSTALNRRYFLAVFDRIGRRLPEIVSSYDHNRLEDELRLTPEPRTDEGYLSPLLYRYRPGFWQSDGLEPLPTMYGQYGSPLDLLPRPTLPRSPTLPVPGGFVLDSDAQGLFTRMYDQLRPPTARMFRQRVPPRFRIGTLGPSTIIRRINELFGPMPVDYNDYWLSAGGEAGAFYAHEQRGPATTERGGAAAIAQGRTITGGTAGTARWTRDVTESTPPVAEGQPSTTTGTTTDRVDVAATAVRLPMPLSGPVPLPLAGIVPYDLFGMGEGVGLHRARQEFHYENSTTETRVTPPAGTAGPATVEEYQTAGRTRGLLDTYQRIARQNRTDMLLFVAGEHVPELSGSSGGAAQEGQDRLRTRLYFITQEGNIYQLAYGIDTRAQLLNYLYAGANTQQVLGSVRAVGRHLLTGDSAAAGFDGAAIGFTLPTGTGTPPTETDIRGRIADELGITVQEAERLQRTPRELRRRLEERGITEEYINRPVSEGDTFSSLVFGQLVRRMGSEVPVHAEQALGSAVTHLLTDRGHRDVYAGFYRGAETVTMDPADATRISDSRFAEGTGEVMWRRMRTPENPLGYQFEARLAGGYPTTVAGRFRYEWRPSRYRTNALGITAAYSHIDLLREVRAAGSDADQIYGGLQTVLTSLYGWSEDEARDTGWLAAGSYLYARMEDWTVRNPDGSYTTTAAGPEGTPEQHFASAMFMYWAQRHGILMGAQRVPGWTRIYDRIDQAMRQIQMNPTNEATILETLSRTLRDDLQRDIWRFALAYGYDGERVRIYTVAGGQWTSDETAYGNLYSMFIFGRPAAGYVDILGHAYGYSPLVISEDASTTSGFSVRREDRVPFVDLYTGFGIIDWPSIEVDRYERTVTIHNSPDPAAALRTAYTELGGLRNRARLTRSFGEPLMALVEEGSRAERGRGLEWMVRPAAEVRTELERLRGEEDAVALSFLNLQRGREGVSQPAAARDAQALIDIYTELRRAAPDRARLEAAYSREMVDLVERHAEDFSWVLLPDDRMRAEFERRARRSGSLEGRMRGVEMPSGPGENTLTGAEVKRLIEQNLVDVVVAATDAQTRRGIAADRYDVLLGRHLQSAEGGAARSGTYYILHTPVAERPEATGSIMIGDETDLAEWQRNGHEIGRGISRLEISRGEGGDYTFTVSGDRRTRIFTGVRAVGGITLPIRPDDYSQFRVGSSWTVGGIVQVLQNHRTDILAGAQYGVREYGNERWDQWTVTVSGRLQGMNTSTVSDNWYGYVFFNRMTRRAVVASGDVMTNADELRNVCQTLGGPECSSLADLERMTGGVGLQWARTDVVTGDRMSFHFFFEGGVETMDRYDQTAGASALSLTPNRYNQFVGRGGAAFSYTHMPTNSTVPNIFSVGIEGQSGAWPVMPGSVTQPEYLQSFGQTMETWIPGWSFMLYGRAQW